MSLEDKIEKLTAAIEAHTQALNNTGVNVATEAPAVEVVPKTKKSKATKARPRVSDPDLEPPALDTTPDEPTEEVPPVTLDVVRKALVALGRDGITVVMEQFDIRKIPELDEAQYAEFHKAIEVYKNEHPKT